jgi:TM2 domain-containing membrane protein YozV
VIKSEDKKVSKSAIARILGAHRLTVAKFVKGIINVCGIREMSICLLGDGHLFVER